LRLRRMKVTDLWKGLLLGKRSVDSDYRASVSEFHLEAHLTQGWRDWATRSPHQSNASERREKVRDVTCSRMWEDALKPL
jgi:hypothetical protein